MSPRRHYHLRQRAQSLVETALVLPIVMLVTLGGIMFLIWQLDINSAQFGAEVGIQLADIPTNAQNTGPTVAQGLLCNETYRAYHAITSQSFLGGTPLARTNNDGDNREVCAASVGFAEYLPSGSGPIQFECPKQAGVAVVPTTANMQKLLDDNIGNANNAMAICAWSDATSLTPTTASLTVKIVVVGYKPSQLPSLLSNRIPFYGQATETVQEFTQ